MCKAHSAAHVKINPPHGWTGGMGVRLPIVLHFSMIEHDRPARVLWRVKISLAISLDKPKYEA